MIVYTDSPFIQSRALIRQGSTGSILPADAGRGNIQDSSSPRIPDHIKNELPADMAAEAGDARSCGNGENPAKRARSRGGKNIIFRVHPEEHAAIAQCASEAGLTMSEFIRRVVEGHATYSRYDYDVLEKLVAIHTDMNRLGNLFKMALGELKETERPWEYRDHERSRLGSVLASIESNQELWLIRFLRG